MLEVIVDAPADVQLAYPSTETYIHNTKAAINKTFDRKVNEVYFTSPGQQYNNGAPTNPIRDCPLPSINGNQIISDFDNYYADNESTCSYQVTFVQGISVNGKIYPSDDYQYTVSCDDDCPEGSHKCTHGRYPGYCCVPCQKVGSKLKNIASKVGR
ncbi:hypothetical protein [Nostoc sp. NMS8]|uniref:hypothetical protein n=1 Tax=Nostoc sp. NMS8 TaxID=2815392 RepID=UPI0025DFEF9D|nr:hypothetical protein [Nostoc sp. NMS8]MBN3959257.1 hypothetical protein [Nostoc sp. NMS8]